jgi:multidrug resistance efflux pump
VAEPAGKARDVVRVRSPLDGTVLALAREVKPGERVPAGDRVTWGSGKEARKLRRLHEGDAVEPGQLLVVLEDTRAGLELAGAKAELDAAQADQEAAKATFREAQFRLDRLEKLKAAGAPLVSAEEYSAAVLYRDRNKQEEVSKAAGVATAEAKVRLAEFRLGEHQIRSAWHGTILAFQVQPGEVVLRGEPLLEIRLTRKRD